MIRYAVVGAGWISQEAFLPGVAQSGNSCVAALVTGDPGRVRPLAEFHGIPQVVSYAEYDALLAGDPVDVDAVYIALPNSMHADYAIRAARAGKHVLVEKPLSRTEAEARAMIAAAEAAGVFLMTAYRLHNEPGTIAVLEKIRAGAIGRPLFFQSVFGFQAKPGNHRLKAEHWGGPLQDMVRPRADRRIVPTRARPERAGQAGGFAEGWRAVVSGPRAVPARLDLAAVLTNM